MPKVVDHDQRRSEITVAAAAAIAGCGRNGATMRRIAELANCTTGRLNHYFDSHDDILVAALRHVHLSAANRMRQSSVGLEGIDALRACVLEALPLDNQRLGEWKVWIEFWGTALFDAQLAKENEERYREWRSLLRTLLSAAFPGSGLHVTVETERLNALIDGLGLHLTLRPTKTARLLAIQTIERHFNTLSGEFRS